MSVSLLITNRKSHTGFRLIPTSMTLNDLERRNCTYFAFFSPNSIALLANYVILVEDRPIMSVKCCLPFTVFHFWRHNYPSLQRGLSAIAELLVVCGAACVCVQQDTLWCYCIRHAKLSAARVVDTARITLACTE